MIGLRAVVMDHGDVGKRNSAEMTVDPSGEVDILRVHEKTFVEQPDFVDG